MIRWTAHYKAYRCLLELRPTLEAVIANDELKNQNDKLVTTVSISQVSSSVPHLDITSYSFGFSSSPFVSVRSYGKPVLFQVLSKDKNSILITMVCDGRGKHLINQ